MTNENLDFWTPLTDDSGERQGLERVVDCDGFTVTGTWTENDGYGAYIDHDHDGPFTLTELYDLWTTLQAVMKDIAQHENGPQTAPEQIDAAIKAGDYDRAAKIKAALLEAQQPAVSR